MGSFVPATKNIEVLRGFFNILWFGMLGIGMGKSGDWEILRLLRMQKEEFFIVFRLWFAVVVHMGQGRKYA